MTHLPRPTFRCLDAAVEQLFCAAQPELERAGTPLERSRILRRFLLEAFEAGSAAQRELALIVLEHSPRRKSGTYTR